jgi:hypothetical protein
MPGFPRHQSQRLAHAVAPHQRAAGEQYRNLSVDLLAAEQEPVFGRTLQGVPQRGDAARDDGDLLHGVRARQGHRDQRMTHLMAGHGLPLLRAQQAALFLEPGDDAFDRGREVLQHDRLRTAPRGEQRGFVDEVGEVRPRETGGHGRHGLKIRASGHPDLAHMHLQDVEASLEVGTVNQHLTVEATRA